MMAENGTPDEEKPYLERLSNRMDFSKDEHYVENEPVRIYITASTSETGNLNTGIPESVWPLTQLGDLYITGGRLRDFIRVRASYEGQDHRLMAVVAPCPCEWIEDIANICLRQGGVHKDYETEAKGYFTTLNKMMLLSGVASLPIEPRNKCQRTLILD